ncbi:hypothetical protein GOV10_01145 [Candidatus Woesearchaeota archaeon]|nr:hypothetical protein [Candidatus Woesearchaeota archaeon]
MRRTRRAQLAHPLNWILVLIAGAFFLILFIAIIRMVTDTNRGLTDVKTLGRVQNIIDSSQSDPGTMGIYSLPKIITRCELGNPYTIELSGQTREYLTQALFSPRLLDGETIIWSEELRFPAPITSTTYLFPENTLVLILKEDGDLHYTITNLLDSLNTKEIYPADLETYNARGHDLVIVLSAGDLNTRNFRTSAQVHGVRIQGGARPSEVGTLTFYKNTGQFVDDGGASYATKELLLAGIFAGSRERYLCGRSVVEERMLFLSTLEYERLMIINNTLETVWPEKCLIAYDQALTLYEGLNNQLDSSGLGDTGPLHNIKSQLLIQHNVLRKEGCPALR